ncbi:hypothetical protein C922_05597 [Plasmodium inui San Antonio 1]|uniref:Pv-fam-d protein n=1 Tax=Plasmodium inui San Antonio 1 TaxID=1237626 RepID=W6ZT12_9APIC|nr:hypothetical protein C922_05597 [Plasmodium inui San Antonio 1]EUD64022.1 hypothetical protein C922_05597 [Plasmodium inui San Antonio 1]
MITFRKALTLSLLMSTWQCYHKSLGPSTVHHNESKLNNLLNKKFGRILHEKNLRNTNLKRRIINLLKEDDDDFRERLNALSHDYHFRRLFNVLIVDDLFQEQSRDVIRDKHFQEQFHILKDNAMLDLEVPIPLYDNDCAHAEGNKFRSCQNFERHFDKLKIQEHKEEKEIQELESDEEYKSEGSNIRCRGYCNDNQREKLRGSVHYAGRPLYGIEHDIPCNLEHNEDLKQTFEDYTNNRTVKPKSRLILIRMPKKKMSTHELESLNSKSDSLQCSSSRSCKRPPLVPLLVYSLMDS